MIVNLEKFGISCFCQNIMVILMFMIFQKLGLELFDMRNPANLQQQK